MLPTPNESPSSTSYHDLRGAFQPTGDGGGGGGCSNLELESESEEYVYLGCREVSIARAMSWLQVDEERTDGRKLA